MSDPMGGLLSGQSCLSASRAYQGELLDKSGVFERWKAKADRALADRSSIVSAEWDDLRAVWEQIIRAFPP